MKFILTLFIIWASGALLGSALMSMHYKSKMKDMHCQPITTHSTIESAKAKVASMQALGIGE